MPEAEVIMLCAKHFYTATIEDLPFFMLDSSGEKPGVKTLERKFFALFQDNPSVCVHTAANAGQK
jgi:hypothetical protein